MKIPPILREASYSAALAREPGWYDVLTELESDLAERGISIGDPDCTFYLSSEFVDGNPSTVIFNSDPPEKKYQHQYLYNTNMYNRFKTSLCPTLVHNPMHRAIFRYQNGSWQAARVFDHYQEMWSQWRGSRARFQADRLAWFRQLAKQDFDELHETMLYILVDQETTEQMMLPLLIGLEGKSVWMMTSGFSDRLNPRSGKNWEALACCNAEILFRYDRAQLGKAADSLQGLAKSEQVIAMEQVAEAFYWQYVDGLAKRREDPDVAFSKPQRHQTLSDVTRATHVLPTDAPFLLSRYEKQGQIALSDGRQVTPALVTLEGALGSKLKPELSSIIKRATGGLGKAPKTFEGPSDMPLFDQLREQIAATGSVQSVMLKKRLRHLAGLELHYGRTLPEDIAPHLDALYLVEFGTRSMGHHLGQVSDCVEFDPELHKMPDADYDLDVDELPVYKKPSLKILEAYTGLKRVDLRSSSGIDLSWLESVYWLEELLLNSSSVQDLSAIAKVPGLKRLDLGQTEVEHLAPLSALTQLEDLNLHGLQISDISVLSELRSLKKLNLSHMPLCDISWLSALPHLEELLLGGIDGIKDYSVLSSLPNLKLLSVAQTSIDDLSILPAMPMLETLYVWDCYKLKDISPLDRYEHLKPVNTRGTCVV